jgi:replicative DNA helicase
VHISINSFPRATFTGAELASLHAHHKRIRELPFHLEDARGNDIASVVSRLRQLKAKYNIKVAVVDYLQRVTSTVRRDGARYLEVAEVSNRLMDIALELNIVIIARANSTTTVRRVRVDRLGRTRTCT